MDLNQQKITDCKLINKNKVFIDGLSAFIRRFRVCFIDWCSDRVWDYSYRVCNPITGSKEAIDIIIHEVELWEITHGGI